jgi:hypothetical protein
VAATHLKDHLQGREDIRRSLSSRVAIRHSSPVIRLSSQVAIRHSSPVIRLSSRVAIRHSSPVIRLSSQVAIRSSRRPDIRLSSSQGPMALKGLVASLQAVPLHRARRARS